MPITVYGRKGGLISTVLSMPQPENANDELAQELKKLRHDFLPAAHQWITFIPILLPRPQLDTQYWAVKGGNVYVISYAHLIEHAHKMGKVPAQLWLPDSDWRQPWGILDNGFEPCTDCPKPDDLTRRYNELRPNYLVHVLPKLVRVLELAINHPHLAELRERGRVLRNMIGEFTQSCLYHWRPLVQLEYNIGPPEDAAQAIKDCLEVMWDKVLAGRANEPKQANGVNMTVTREPKIITADELAVHKTGEPFMPNIYAELSDLRLLEQVRDDFAQMRLNCGLVTSNITHLPGSAEAEGVIGLPLFRDIIAQRRTGHRGGTIIEASRWIRFSGKDFDYQRLRGLAERAGQTILRLKNMQVLSFLSGWEFIDEDEPWWNVIYEIGWSNRHPQLKVEKQIWVQYKKTSLFIPYDIEQVRSYAYPQMGELKIPDNWLNKLPDAYTSYIRDTVTASLDAANYLISEIKPILEKLAMTTTESPGVKVESGPHNFAAMFGTITPVITPETMKALNLAAMARESSEDSKKTRKRSKPNNLQEVPLTDKERCLVQILAACELREGRTGKQITAKAIEFRETIEQSELTKRLIPALRAKGIRVKNARGAGYYLADTNQREQFRVKFNIK
jgi:hypothetical protein